MIHLATGEASAVAIARAEASLIRQAAMDAQSTPRPASCLCDVARVFTKHLSAEVRDWGVEFSVQNPMCDLLCSPHSPPPWRPLLVRAALKNGRVS
jgi:hypothetical protein